jgi:ATP-dependent RNA helicase DDX42
MQEQPAPAAAPAAPAPAAAAAADDDDDDEYDPLEAFMAEINQEVAENRPNKPPGAQQAAAACDEAADPATEYMAVRGCLGIQLEGVACVDVAGSGCGMR